MEIQIKDVYKRQDEAFIEKAPLRLNNGIQAPSIQKKHFKPVSYTHLDVYKRQLKEHSLIMKVNMIRTPNLKIECPLPYYNSPCLLYTSRYGTSKNKL